jgi:LacI family transcriptional regulator
VTIRRRLTIIDIAREAAVSKTTVSRVLSGSPSVAADTRARVMEATRKFGFRVNPAARGLRTQRSGMVGLMVPMLREPFGMIAEELDQTLAEQDLGLVISCSRWDSRQDLLSLESLLDRGVDALALSVADDRSREISTRLRSLRVPVLLLDREIRGFSTDAIITDQRSGMSEAVDHLALLGRCRIGLITIRQRTRPVREMAAAFHEACSVYHPNEPPLVVEADSFNRRSSAVAAGKLLDAGVDAVIVGPSVSLTAGALDCFAERGLRLPEDVALIVFDENELASAKAPRLTVISRDIHQWGRLAGELIIRRLLEPASSFQVRTLRTHLVVGASTPSADALAKAYS